MTAQATMIAAQARLTESQTASQEAVQKAQQSTQEAQLDAQTKMQELAAKERIASLGVSREIVIHSADQAAADRKLQSDNQNRAADRVHKLAIATAANRSSAQQGVLDRTHQALQSGLEMKHQAAQSGLDRHHEAQQGGIAQQHEGVQNDLDRQADLAAQPPEGGVAP